MIARTYYQWSKHWRSTRLGRSMITSLVLLDTGRWISTGYELRTCCADDAVLRYTQIVPHEPTPRRIQLHKGEAVAAIARATREATA